MFTFRPSFIPSNIFVVGCGGTGSRLVPTLVQFIRSITKEHVPSGWLGATNIVLIDGDVVEQKNLLRQNFVANDVGKNKASVLAQRYGKAYGMNVAAYPRFIEDGETQATLRNKITEVTGVQFHSTNCGDMVIMCVDSAKARRLILKTLSPAVPGNNNNAVFIDAGNEDSFGQVRMFTSTILLPSGGAYIDKESLRRDFPNPDRIEAQPKLLSYIPYDHMFYENLADNPGLGSCADLDQTLAINSLMATFIMSFVQNYFYNKVIDYNEVSVDIVKGITEYTKNTIANYRSKAYTQEDSKHYIGFGQGHRYGIVGTVEKKDFTAAALAFIEDNNHAIRKADIERAKVPKLKLKSEANAEEVVIEAAPEEVKKPARKKPASKKEEVGSVEGAASSVFQELVTAQTNPYNDSY